VVRWDEPLHDADGRELSGLAGYVIMRPDVGTGTAVPIATVAVNVREYVDTGVRSLTSYRYAVTALNEKWQQQSGGPAVPITTSGLAALTNVTATDGIGRIDVLAIVNAFSLG